MSEELKAKLVGVRRVIHELRLSMQVFRDYGYQHQDKAESADDPKERAERERKAKRNFDRAAACEDALDFFAASRTPTEAEPGARNVYRLQASGERLCEALRRIADGCDNPAKVAKAALNHKEPDPDWKATATLRSTTPASDGESNA